MEMNNKEQNMNLDFEKLIVVGEYAVGVVYDNNQYHIVDNVKGKIYSNDDKYDVIEKYEQIICEELNTYFDDIWNEEEKLIN